MINDLKIIAEKWNEISFEFDEMHDTEDISIWKRELKKLLGEERDISVLDIGTGTGFLAIMLAELGYNSFGIDIAEDMLSIARTKALSKNLNINFLHSEEELLPFEEYSMDVIVNCRLLWTLTNPQKTFKDWNKVLKNGGRVLSFMRLAEKNEENKNWCYGEEFESKLPLKFATEVDYIKVFKNAGYKNIKIIHMTKEMSNAPLNPWFCIECEK